MKVCNKITKMEIEHFLNNKMNETIQRQIQI